MFLSGAFVLFQTLVKNQNPNEMGTFAAIRIETCRCPADNQGSNHPSKREIIKQMKVQISIGW